MIQIKKMLGFRSHKNFTNLTSTKSQSNKLFDLQKGTSNFITELMAIVFTPQSGISIDITGTTGFSSSVFLNLLSDFMSNVAASTIPSGTLCPLRAAASFWRL